MSKSYGKYIIKRILVSLLVVFIISVFVFSLMHLIPGDPVKIMLGGESDEAVLQAYREKLHLTEPLPVQYWLWLTSALRGDFGTSYALNGQDIGTLMAQRFPVTLSLAVPCILLSTILGVLIGVICAVRRGSALDQVLTVLLTAMNGVPIFWIGIVFIWVFGLKLRWFPVMGYTSPSQDFIGYLRSIAMPVTIMCFGPLSAIARQTRTNMLEVINQDYIRTAKANGLGDRSIKYRHALKNALIPIVTIVGIQFRWAVGGSLFIEQIFAINGIGKTVMLAITSRDYTMIQACTFIISVFVVGVNLVLDILYGYLDPRIRQTGGEEGK